METMQTKTVVRPFNTQWVLVGYCYFIWFHLLPSVLYVNLLTRFTPGPSVQILIWFIGGIMLLSGYIGFRSRGFTVLEPGVSAVLYMWTVFLIVPLYTPHTSVSRITLMVLSISIITFTVAVLGAFIGEYLQALGMRKNRIQEPEARIQ